MFFVVRLALSELVMFGAAYAVTGTGTLALVTTYLLPVLNTGSRPWSPPCRIGLRLQREEGIAGPCVGDPRV